MLLKPHGLHVSEHYFQIEEIYAIIEDKWTLLILDKLVFHCNSVKDSINCRELLVPLGLRGEIYQNLVLLGLELDVSLLL